MYIRHYGINGAHYVAACISGHLIWARYSPPSLLQNIKLPEGTSAFDVSSDGCRLAAGYWGTKVVDLWDLETGKHIIKFGPNHVTRVAFDSTGRYVTIGVPEARIIYDLKEGLQQRILRGGDLYGSCVKTRDNTMLIPTSEKGCIYRFHSEKASMEKVRLARLAVVWTMRWSPTESHLLMMEDNGRVSCRAEVTTELIWEHTLNKKDLSSQCVYTEDGKLIGIAATEAMQTIVLDAITGKVINRYDIRLGSPHPLQTTKAMLTNGQILNTSPQQGKWLMRRV